MKLLNPGLLQSLYQLNHQGSYIFIEPVPIWSEMNSLFFFLVYVLPKQVHEFTFYLVLLELDTFLVDWIEIEFL